MNQFQYSELHLKINNQLSLLGEVGQAQNLQNNL